MHWSIADLDTNITEMISATFMARSLMWHLGTLGQLLQWILGKERDKGSLKSLDRFGLLK